MVQLPQLARTQIAKFPEVTSLVVTDGAGGVLESVGDIDAEALGGVHVVVAQALARCGHLLGLGLFGHATVVGGRYASLTAFHDNQILAVYLDPARPMSMFENKLDTVLRR